MSDSIQFGDFSKYYVRDPTLIPVEDIIGIPGHGRSDAQATVDDLARWLISQGVANEYDPLRITYYQDDVLWGVVYDAGWHDNTGHSILAALTSAVYSVAQRNGIPIRRPIECIPVETPAPEA